ncbi:MAG TPA: deoxynucleoside kinase [Candidatus Bipolaricaulota bacterium]|nr:deoxynucleoside kinase [Candidatus Bipolaricaulota bacterium]
MKKFIAIAGNIGVGKTTLSKKLAEYFNWSSYVEPAVENPYLADFYQDMNKWAFLSQLYFLSKRLEDQYNLSINPGSVILDRSLYENSEVFAKNLFLQGFISTRDWQVYQKFYKICLNILPAPDVVIYLKASTETIMARVKKRGREFENLISREYVESLNKLYAEWTENFKVAPVLTIDYDKVDLKHNQEDFDDFISKISSYLMD